jgi:hypothetical protein
MEDMGMDEKENERFFQKKAKKGKIVKDERKLE